MLQKVEINQRRVFEGIEKGIGKCENYLLVIMSKNGRSQGCDWKRANREIVKFVQDKNITVVFQ